MFVLNEGNKPKVYWDSKGNHAIGIGFNLEVRLIADSSSNKALISTSCLPAELVTNRQRLFTTAVLQTFKDAQSYDSNFAKRPEAVKMTLVDGI